MPRITLGNKLYLYDLLAREVGVGKQTMLARVEEVLLADDIMPCDMDCEDTRELLEALDDFVRLTVFKRGRVYATVIEQPQWDEILSRLASEADNPEKGAANVGGPKAWKRKKSKKDPRPAKPRPYGRPEAVEEPEAEVAEVETATAEATDVAEDKVTEALAAGEAVKEAAPETVEETEHAAAEPGKATAAAEVVEVKPAESETAEAEVEETEAKVEVKATEAEPIAEHEEQETALGDETSNQAANTIVAEASNEAPKQDADEPARKPRVRRRRHIVASAETAEVKSRAADAEQSDTAEAPEAGDAPRAQKASVLEEPQAETVAAKPEPEPEIMTETAEEPEPEIETEPEPEPEPTSSPQKPAFVLSPSFWDPVPAPAPRGQSVLPRDFISEVSVSNEALAALYEVLPWDMNPIELLARSWEVATEVRSFSNTDGVITFELLAEAQVAQDDEPSPTGEALVARMRPTRRTASGKRWRLL